MRTLRVVDVFAAKICVNAHPLHHAPAPDLFFADDRDVIFRLTGEDAGIAADARIKVNRHSPFVAVVFKRRIHRSVVFVVLAFFARFDFRLQIINLENAQQVAPFHIEMSLSRRDGHLFAGFRDVARAEIHRVGFNDIVSVITQIRSDSSGSASPVTEINGNHVVRLTGRNPHRHGLSDLSALKLKHHQIGKQIFAFRIVKSRA